MPLIKKYRLQVIVLVVLLVSGPFLFHMHTNAVHFGVVTLI